MKKIFFVLLLLIIAAGSNYAQTVSGTVTDADDGQPLPGVNVAVQATSMGTLTDENGKYTIEVSNGTALVFSFIGYAKQVVQINGKSVINVSMSADDQLLDDVVVTALGISREKKALGYAITEIGSDAVSEVKESNVMNSLAGRVAGVTITQSTGGLASGSRLVIRGNNSLTGNNQPLYVVDGVTVDNSGFGTAAGTGTANYSRADYGTGVSDLNPDDIESITVLKGPNAAAMYGSRAANGVVLITTKKGKSSQGLGVSFSSQTTFERPMVLPEFQNEYGQGSEGLTYTDVNELKNHGGSWGAKFDGTSQLYYTGENRTYSANENNVSDFFQTAKNYVNTVAIDGGNDNSTFRFSYTNNENTGMLENSSLKRNNFNLRATSKMGKLSIDSKITYFTQAVKNRAVQGTEGIMAYLWDIPRNLDLEDYKDYKAEDLSVNSYTNSGGNPYWILYEDKNEDSRNRMQGFVKATYEITDFLSAFVRAGTDVVNQRIETVNKPGHWYFGSGRFSYSDYKITESNFDYLFMFDKNLNDDLRITANIGGNILYQTYSAQWVNGQDFKIPTKPTTASAAILDPYYVPVRKKRINSLYGSTQVSYKDMVYLDLSGRNDWSSTLPSDNWSYFYPAAGLSFLLNEVIDADILNYAKLRFSWAKVGADTDPYQIVPTYNLDQDGYLGLTTLSRPTVKMNEDLKPEYSESLEFGFDFRILDNRVFADISYYNIKSKDLIMDVPVPASTGYSFFRENVGQTTNKGLEVVLGGTPVKNGNFSWDVSLNFSKNKNTIDKLTEELDSYTFSTTNSGGAVVKATVGGGFGDIYAKTYQTTESGDIIVGADGKPLLTAETEHMGNYQPEWVGGMMNTLVFKGFKLNFLIDARIGGQIYSGTDAGLDATGVSARSLEYREGGITIEGVVDDGTGNFVANTTSITAEDYWSSRAPSDYIYDQTNIRLRELSLSYQLPASLFQNNFLRSASISLIGRNLFFLYTKMENFDPETSYSTSNYAQGMLWYNMPTTRSLGVNLNIKF